MLPKWVVNSLSWEKWPMGGKTEDRQEGALGLEWDTLPIEHLVPAVTYCHFGRQ